MDRLDRQIIQCLRYNGRAPFRRIAEVLEVSEQTVARRFRTLHSRGTLRVTVVRDPRAAGRQVWSVRPSQATPTRSPMPSGDDPAPTASMRPTT